MPVVCALFLSCCLLLRGYEAEFHSEAIGENTRMFGMEWVVVVRQSAIPTEERVAFKGASFLVEVIWSVKL